MLLKQVWNTHTKSYYTRFSVYSLLFWFFFLELQKKTWSWSYNFTFGHPLSLIKVNNIIIIV